MDLVFLTCKEDWDFTPRFSDILLFASLPKIAKVVNSVDPDEVAHHEPPHLELRCLPHSL